MALLDLVFDHARLVTPYRVMTKHTLNTHLFGHIDPVLTWGLGFSIHLIGLFVYFYFISYIFHGLIDTGESVVDFFAILDVIPDRFNDTNIE